MFLDFGDKDKCFQWYTKANDKFIYNTLFTCHRMLSPPIFKRCIRFELSKSFH